MNLLHHLAVWPSVLSSAAEPAPEPEPSPAPESQLFADLDEACFRGADSKGTLCRWVYDRTDNEWLAQSSDWLIVKPGKVLLILVVAWVIRRMIHRAIGHLADGIADGRPQITFGRKRALDDGTSGGPLVRERRRQRAQAMASVLRSVATGAILTIALLMALAELGLNIGPLIAGAGILGVALGFGAQSLVKDFLSGIFMIIEDQFGIGDDVDLGDAIGTVEAVGLRITRVRDVNGTAWYVRNGEVLRVGNMSQGWARSVLDVGVGYGEDVPRVRELLADCGRDLAEDPELGPLILEPPSVWGVQALSADSVVIRMVVKTKPGSQWKISREARERIKASLDAHGVEMPFPQRTIWVRNEGPGDAGSGGALPNGRSPATDAEAQGERNR